MRAILAFVRAYPRQSVLVLTALVVAGTLEGISMTALLPVLTVALEREPADPSGVGGIASKLLRGIGLEPTITTLLALLVVGITATSVVGAAREARNRIHRCPGRDRSTAPAPALADRGPLGVLPAPAGRQALERDGRGGGRRRSSLPEATTMVASAIQTAAYSAVAFAVSWKATAAYIVVALVIAVALHSMVRLARRAGKRSTKMMTQLMTGLSRPCSR